jgi:hypothetical protein
VSPVNGPKHNGPAFRNTALKLPVSENEGPLSSLTTVPVTPEAQVPVTAVSPPTPTSGDAGNGDLEQAAAMNAAVRTTVASVIGPSPAV